MEGSHCKTVISLQIKRPKAAEVQSFLLFFKQYDEELCKQDIKSVTREKESKLSLF